MNVINRVRSAVSLVVIMFAAVQIAHAEMDDYAFTKQDITFLKLFTLEALPSLPEAPSNKVADDPKAVDLGHKLFFDANLSADGTVSCATCHQPQKYFTDGLAQSKAIGTTRRSAPTILGGAYSPWQFWDGRKDSLWAQALAPLENPDEHGLSRAGVVKKVAEAYSDEYQSVFGPLPKGVKWSSIKIPASPNGDKAAQDNWAKLDAKTQSKVNLVFSNVGKAIMAYERQLKLTPAPFDRFIAAMESGNTGKAKEIMTPDQVKGLRLFMGEANCASCHNGPLFTNYEFHNIGAPESDPENVELGRYGGVKDLVKDEFTCLSEWSDANKEVDCLEMSYLKTEGPELVGALKTPTLRNIAQTAPYMQNGQFSTLTDVLAHYNKPKPPLYDPKQHPNRPHFDILPLAFDEDQISQIIEFLGTLTTPLPENDPLWFPPGKVDEVAQK